MRTGKKGLTVWVFLLLSLFFISQAAFARGEDDEPGIPGQKPLYFLSITMRDSGQDVQNAVDIPVNPEFRVSFSKNVVNSVLWENNRKCFALVSRNNESVPLSVTKIDDTIDVNQRHNVFIRPEVPLHPGTSYTLRVSPELKAKNGVSTLGGTTSGQGITVSFKTAGGSQQSVEPAGAVPPAGSNQAQAPANTTVEGNNGTSKQPDNPDRMQQQSALEAAPDGEPDGQQSTSGFNLSQAEEVASPAAKDEAVDSPGEAKYFNWTNLMTLLFVVLVAVWIGIEFYIKRKKK